MKTIKVDGKNFECRDCFGIEYPDHKCHGYPFEPYQFEKVIDEKHAYLVDSKGIIWILEEEFGKQVFARPCLRYCLYYIMYYDKDMHDKKPSEVLDEIRVSDIRAPLYDQEDEEIKNLGM